MPLNRSFGCVDVHFAENPTIWPAQPNECAPSKNASHHGLGGGWVKKTPTQHTAKPNWWLLDPHCDKTALSEAAQKNASFDGSDAIMADDLLPSAGSDWFFRRYQLACISKLNVVKQ